MIKQPSSHNPESQGTHQRKVCRRQSLLAPAKSLHVLLLSFLFFAGAAPVVAQNPVILDFQTSLGNDSLIMGVPGLIRFSADANGNQIAALQFSMAVQYSGTNLIGALRFPGNLVPSAAAQYAFQTIVLNENFSDGIGADSMCFGFISFSRYWDTSGEVWRINVQPPETGTIRFDSILTPLANVTEALNPMASSLPLTWLVDGREITVYIPTGDVDGTGTITAADIVYLVGFVFKSQSAPMPCAASGDVDCSGDVTASDIIYLVAHVFKSGPAPCDVTSLIPDTWSCP